MPYNEKIDGTKSSQDKMSPNTGKKGSEQKKVSPTTAKSSRKTGKVK